VILDLFAGPGGWSEGLRTISLTDIGIEWDDAACRTRAAAGHHTIRADVSQYPTEPFTGRVEGLIASPPCTDFSMAGNRAGLDGNSGHLVAEVMRWADALRPEWIACEQVPPVLGIWQSYAAELRTWGYSAWAGVLNSADYGVPQTRRRAILMASRVRPVAPPEPTHARDPAPGLFGELEPWVSMADALGWGPGDAMTYKSGGGMTERYGERPDRPASSPAPTITGTALGGNGGAKIGRIVDTRRDQRPDGTTQTFDPDCSPALTLTAASGGQWVLRSDVPQRHGVIRTLDEPAPTILASADNGNAAWVYDRPATTVAGDPRITARCHHDEGSQGANAKTTDQVQAGDYDGTEPIKLTVEEALILQSFPADYPVQGTKTKRFEQIGNAVPPRLAAHIIGALR